MASSVYHASCAAMSQVMMALEKPSYNIRRISAVSCLDGFEPTLITPPDSSAGVASVG